MFSLVPISFNMEQLEDAESRKLDNTFVRVARISWQLLLVPWRVLFAFVPPYQIVHGWPAFICSLIFISGIAYVVTKLTDLISCVTGFLFVFLFSVCKLVFIINATLPDVPIINQCFLQE